MYVNPRSARPDPPSSAFHSRNAHGANLGATIPAFLETDAMPSVTESEFPQKRRRPWRVALYVYLALIVLPCAVLFAWSWHEEVTLKIEGKGVSFGRINGRYLGRYTTRQWLRRGSPVIESGQNWGWIAIKLPGGPESDWYTASWFWPPPASL